MKLILIEKQFVGLGVLAFVYISGVTSSLSCTDPCMQTNTSAIVGLQTLQTIDGAPAPGASAPSYQSMQPLPGSAQVAVDNVFVRVQLPSNSLLNSSNFFQLINVNGSPVTGVTGVLDNYAFLNSSIASNASGTRLSLVRNEVTFASLAQTRNQYAVARVLDDAERRGNLAKPVRLMFGLTREEAARSYAALSGETIADARGVANGAVNLVVSTVRDQVVSGTANTISTRDGMRVWATYIGSNLNLSSQSGLSGTQTQTWGGAGAIEKQIDPTLRLGLAAGGTQANLSVYGQQGRAQAGFGHAALYIQKNIDAAYVLGIAGWSFGQTTTSRNVLSSFQTGSFNGQGPNARIEAGYRFAWNSFELTPYAALQGVWLRQNGMNESVNTFAGLYVNGQTVVSLPLSIGVQGKETAHLNADWDLNLRGRAAYMHEFFPSRTITAEFLTIPQSFQASGRAMPSNGVDLGVGIDLVNKNGFSLTATADALLASEAIGWRWQVVAGYKW